jgi:hypothetical protein
MFPLKVITTAAFSIPRINPEVAVEAAAILTD